MIATGMSERHLKAMSAAVEAVASEEERTLLGVEGESSSGWIVVDVGDVVAHLFSAALRAYYDLDGLWADAKVVRPGETPRREDAEREATG
ncbi:unnamed protein product [marine sediment metagenome]|uniref:Ribosome silencing factor n=1 Tax=marine sediment metagenome TaxID=412755 RepID=X0YHM8_9ZZZZ